MVKHLPTYYYQSFPADYSLEYPGEGYGGWQKKELPINLAHTAVVVMHATDVGAITEVPGYYRCVEYLPRSGQIAQDLFPEFMSRVRAAGLRLLHIPLYEQMARAYPGYARTLELVGSEEKLPEQIEADATLLAMRDFRWQNCWVGRDNIADKKKGEKMAGFYAAAQPLGDEHLAFTSRQLFGLCRHYSINHLIYTGFAVNACLMLSPCGFVDMSRHGIMCSVIPQLTTAVENKASCRQQLHKEYGLWAFATQGGGFVYQLTDFLGCLANPAGV